MQESELAEQDDDGASLAEKRARWEHLRFAPCVGVGKVNVCNVSYGVQAKKDHTYTVSVESGIPFDCTCPNWQYNDPPKGCKHMIAVSNAPDVMDEAQPDIATDGGTDTDISYHTEPEHLGGSRYARCNECGAESVEDSEGDYGIMHDSDCSHNDMHLGIVSPDGEY